MTAIMRCCVFAGLLVAPVASAQDESTRSPDEAAAAHMDDEVARRHFEVGRSLYNIGRFLDAATEFEEALRLSGRPELHYNVYVSHRDGGNAREAAAALRRYLDEVEEPIDRPHLEARLEALEESAAERERSEAEASARRAEGRASGATPSDDAAGPGGPGLLPWIVIGAGGVVVLAGAVVGVAALSATSAIEDRCAGSLCPSDYRGLEDDVSEARALATSADVLLVGGTVILGAGLVWALMSAGEADAEAPPVALACGADGCAASWGGRF